MLPLKNMEFIGLLDVSQLFSYLSVLPIKVSRPELITILSSSWV